jgi:hypothetical protein
MKKLDLREVRVTPLNSTRRLENTRPEVVLRFVDAGATPTILVFYP